MFQYLLVVVVEPSGLVVADAVAVGHSCPDVAVRSFEYIADGIVQQFRVVAVVALEGITVVFVESRFRTYPQKAAAVSEDAPHAVVRQSLGSRKLLEHDGRRRLDGTSEGGCREKEAAYKD